jgi:hypothetical protein
LDNYEPKHLQKDIGQQTFNKTNNKWPFMIKIVGDLDARRTNRCRFYLEVF